MESDPTDTYRLLSDEPVLETKRKNELEFLPTAKILARAALYTPDIRGSNLGFRVLAVRAAGEQA